MVADARAGEAFEAPQIGADIFRRGAMEFGESLDDALFQRGEVLS